jgi:hypothetical protein
MTVDDGDFGGKWGNFTRFPPTFLFFQNTFSILK